MSRDALTIDQRRDIAERYIALAETVAGDDRPLKVRIEAGRFLHCPEAIRLYRCQKCLHQYKAKDSCNSRICPDCNKRRRAEYERNVLEAIRGYHHRRGRSYGVKFVTLTFRSRRWDSYPTPTDYKRCCQEVSEFVRRFYHKFAAKKGRNGWYLSKSQWRGAGAIAVPEIGKKGNLHFHLVVYGPYIPQSKLVDAWREITGDSRVIDVRDASKDSRAASPEGCVKYVLKYVGKLPPGAHPSDVAAFAWMLKGSRSIFTWGVFYGIKKAGERDPDRAPFKCPYCFGDLEFRGEGRDPDNVLLVWSDLARYYDPNGPPGAWMLRDYSDLRPGGARDKQYQLISVEVHNGISDQVPAL